MILYSKNHIWVEKESADIVKIGVTDFAQEKLGSIMFVNLPDIGDFIKSGCKFGDIESIKTVSDLISPVDGKVTMVNDDVVDEPDIVNEEPYNSWLIKVSAISFADDLMSEDEYRIFTKGN